MKAATFALMALLSLILVGCASLDPIQRSVTVYPADNSEVVVSETIAHVPPPIEAPVPTQIVTPIPEPATRTVSDQELTCLSLAIYHEARGEKIHGQAAVAWVVLNRLEHPRYPKTICGVVKQSGRTKTGKLSCQFSWYCDGNSDVPKDLVAYRRAQDIALQVWNGTYPNPVGRSLFFDGFVHGSPKKAGQMQIGAHRFYASYGNRG